MCTYCTYNVHIQGPRKLSCIFEQYLFHAILLHSRVECFFLFQNFGVRAIARWSKFSFSKNFDANLHEASFYIKEQTHKYKFEIWLFKSAILDPQKSALLIFEENPPKNIFLGFSFKNNRHTNVFWLVFLKMHRKKVIDRQKRHFGRFWRLIIFFVCVLKILIKITFVDLLFLKLKQKKNMKTTFFRFLFQKLKMPFWGGQPIFFF